MTYTMLDSADLVERIQTTDAQLEMLVDYALVNGFLPFEEAELAERALVEACEMACELDARWSS